MNAELLLQNFKRLSEAPAAIPRLRRFILDLAMRGKLVEQDPNDEPATELLKRIQAEKAKLISKGTLKKGKPLPEVVEEDALFALPVNWVWQRLGELANPQAGFAFNSSAFNEAGIGMPIIRIRDVGQPDTRTFFNGEYRDEFIVRKDDYLVSMDGNFRIAKWFGSDALLNQRVSRLQFLSNHLVKRFIAVSLQFRLEDLQGVKTYTTVDHLSGGQIASAVIGVPPLAEQHRIVDKVDELMALCDELEKAKTEREESRDRLAAASLQRLNQPADDEQDFREDALFTFNHLPCITTRQIHIKQLRQTILNLAVRGRLAPQDPNDEPAAELLKKIQAERQELIRQGKARRDKSLAPLPENKQPFTIPNGWEWVKIGDASVFTEYGTSQQSAHCETGVPVLKMGDIQDGVLVLGGQKKVPRTIDDLPALYLKKFDLLYNRTNSAELVGKTGIYLGEDDEYTFASYLIRIRCSRNSTNPVYFNLAMNAPFFRATQIIPHLKQQCGQANVNGTILKNMAIPLPPLAEQHRIVTKVNELIALCDQLETQLTTTEADNRRLLEAVLHEALTPTLEKAA